VLEVLAVLEVDRPAASELLALAVVGEGRRLSKAARDYLRSVLAAIVAGSVEDLVAAAQGVDTGRRGVRLAQVARAMPWGDAQAQAWFGTLLPCGRFMLGERCVSTWAVLPDGRPVAAVVRKGRRGGRRYACITPAAWRTFLLLQQQGQLGLRAYRRVSFLARRHGWAWPCRKTLTNRQRLFEREQPAWRSITGK
jgi:hypothetical protein